MGRKERRAAVRAAKDKQLNSRKPVKANPWVLAGLAAATVVFVLIAQYLRMGG